VKSSDSIVGALRVSSNHLASTASDFARSTLGTDSLTRCAVLSEDLPRIRAVGQTPPGVLAMLRGSRAPARAMCARSLLELYRYM